MKLTMRATAILYRLIVMAIVSVLAFGENAWAYTSKKKVTLGEAAGTIAETVTFNASYVQQNTADAPLATLSFGSAATSDVRDSGGAIKLDFDTNALNARMTIYTDNKNTTGTTLKKSTRDASIGVDSGGLVNQSDTAIAAPLLYALEQINKDYVFDPAKIFGTGVGASFTLADKDHSMSFVATLSDSDRTRVGFSGTLAQFRTEVDNSNCTGFPSGTKAANADVDNDGLYPQLFGKAGVTSDLNCNLADPDGTTDVLKSEELSKNFAVLAFNPFGKEVTVVDLFDINGNGIVNEAIKLTAPIYLPIGADLRGMPAGDYKTNTLTVELVSQ